ncbi:MAG TPA: hypothetical protein VD864_01295, partial [Nocardioides sp.]|nr:hypothetical protein [Nocardioides sp.]
MTTTPIGPSVPAVDQGAPSSTGSGCGGDVFLALVQGLLDAEPVPAPAPTSTTASDAAEPAPGDAAPGEDDTPPADPALLDPTVPSLFVPTIVASLVASVAPGLLAEGGDQAGA